MTLYTHRGLKLRLPIDYAFALMQRLYPTVDAFEVLKLTETIKHLPNALTLLTGVCTFALRLQPIDIFVCVFLASVLAGVLVYFGLFQLIPIWRISYLLTNYSGFGVILPLVALIGFMLVGWKGVLAFFSAKVLSSLFKFAIDMIKMKIDHPNTGNFIASPERAFLFAYRYYSSKLGNKEITELSDNELETHSWNPVFNDLSRKWPEVVARFYT